MRWKKKTLKERFYEKIGLDWMWNGNLDSHGYGQLKIGGKTLLAHRVSYQIHNGEIPEGLHVLHDCDIRNCVNPEHLHLGTNADNVRERMERGKSTAHRGEEHGRAKLTAKQVQDIRARFNNGETQLSLGREYGVNQTHISRIVNKVEWRHVE